MTDAVIVDNAKSTLVDTPESVFTAPVDTSISAFTATNDTTSSKTYKAYINSTTDPVVPLTIIVRDKNHTGSGAVGQVIPAGKSLYVESSAVGSISFFVTGNPLA